MRKYRWYFILILLFSFTLPLVAKSNILIQGHEMVTVKDLKVYKLHEVVKDEYIIESNLIFDYKIAFLEDNNFNDFVEFIDILYSLKYSEKEVLDMVESINDIEYCLLNELFAHSKFRKKRLSKYLEYIQSSHSNNVDEILLAGNTNIYRGFYTDIKLVSNADNPLVLVNKYYRLPNDYKPKYLKEVKHQYAIYGGIYLNYETCFYFEKLCKDAENVGYSIFAASAFRDFDRQKTIYNCYASYDGRAKADTYSARAGHSEHQTGYAVDVQGSFGIYTDFAKTKEFFWMKRNAHKYGFILRYNIDKQNITGYKYEPWHYRYVGVDAATYMYENDMTFDEYYALFVESNIEPPLLVETETISSRVDIIEYHVDDYTVTTEETIDNYNIYEVLEKSNDNLRNLKNAYSYDFMLSDNVIEPSKTYFENKEHVYLNNDVTLYNLDNNILYSEVYDIGMIFYIESGFRT